MAEVLAISRGYFDLVLRNPGDRFTVPDGMTASWWVAVDEASVPEAVEEPVQETVTETDAATTTATTTTTRKTKTSTTVTAPTAEPFADPVDPVAVASEADQALSGTQPDWVAPDAAI